MMKRLFKKILAWCVRVYIMRTKPYIIGITGSVGKTTCRMIVTHMLHDQLPSLRVQTSEKNFNSEIGLCLAVLDIQTYAPTIRSSLWTLIVAIQRALGTISRPDVLVLEYGIDHPGDMDELLSFVKPHLSILTELDKVHATYFPSAEAIFDEKVKLLQATRDVCFYADTLKGLFENITLSSDVLSFALHEDQNDTDIGFNAFSFWRVDEQVGSEFIVCQGDDRVTKIHTNLLGHEHAGYISLAYEIAQIVAVRFDLSIISHPSLTIDFVLQPGRMSWFLGKRGSLLLDSTYNASPGSMHMMIRLLTDLRGELFPDRQLIFCLGDMRELGSYSEQSHRDLAEHVLHADHLFIIGEEMKNYFLPALLALGYTPSRVTWFSDAEQLGYAVDEYLSKQQDLALLLFKGSQNTIFLEEAVKQLLRYPHDGDNLCRQDTWRKHKKGIG